ncbi:hypothetical protein BD779DRAFT_1770408 [Infundibulicybe gibba]|nr:hypothetical protein BD779DRAFT_1770408 [Infundibulicybe gibba]
MPPKRKRRVLSPPKGLAPGETLNRNTLPGNGSSLWDWVGSEVSTPSQITPDHLLRVYGFNRKNSYCQNIFSISPPPRAEARKSSVDTSPDDDVIVISDDEESPCDKKLCKSNPNCLNFLGQNKWEAEDKARAMFMDAANLGDNPMLTRENQIPPSTDSNMPFKNLGATCYANASLQVWFRDMAFRNGVFHCQAPDEGSDKFKESPIFQLQVTFAALQEGTQNVFNPSKLVESLQLRTTEQQDAQEFSKLFMSHLDAEFKKQSSPAVKSLITDQFQGTQCYGTICKHCRYKSERTADFLEIEINFENNSKLEDRIAALLEPESLLGDNSWYFCPQCDSLQDATRFTELRALPPVFIFPYSDSFLGSKAVAGRDPSNGPEENIYELRGVLLHKGASAYHGHYEAQVYDETNNAWFQFSDELVTKIKTPGQPVLAKRLVVEDDDSNTSTLQNRKHRASARKRRRIDDSPMHNHPPLLSNLPDAYMLIYARKNTCPGGPNPVPPPIALEVVRTLNRDHDTACEAYEQKVKQAEKAFKQIREKIVKIYRSWDAPETEHHKGSVIVSRNALELWLSKSCIRATLHAFNGTEHPDQPIPTGDHSLSQTHRTQISLTEIICEHGRLDPQNFNLMKRISHRAYERIVQDTVCEFSPTLTMQDTCRECVERLFREQLYQLEHPRLVAKFEDASEIDAGNEGYWISKPWLKADPAPDTAEYSNHVLCEHGKLSLNITNRRKISVEATELLKCTFPSWVPVSAKMELCAICDALVHISKEDKRVVRKQAEEEKARLKSLHDTLSDVHLVIDENTLGAIIPTQFLKEWKQWLQKPTDVIRPCSINNAAFICEHNLLGLDPNSSVDMSDSFTIIERNDWNTLLSRGPFIGIGQRAENDGRRVFTTDLPTCHDCYLRRVYDWDTTDITVHLNQTRITDRLNKTEPLQPKTIITYLQRPRQSKRLRQIRETSEKRKFSVTKSTTVKDIKIMIQDELNISTICQRLFHRGLELDDNSATVGFLLITAHDRLDLKETNEVLELDTDDEVPAKKKPREEGRGFDGTLLGGDTPSTSGIVAQPRPQTEEKPCPACTFSNPFEALMCTMCDTLLI